MRLHPGAVHWVGAITQMDSSINKSSFLIPGEASFFGTDGSATYFNSDFDIFRVASGSPVSQMRAQVSEGAVAIE